MKLLIFAAVLSIAVALDANSYVNTINTWAEPHNANGVTPNSIIDSNDEPPCNNQQRMIQRGYRTTSVSKIECDTSLSKDRCDVCTERTHRWVCSSCVKCASDTSACTAECEHQGFKSGTNKCVVCPVIDYCPRKATSCSVTDNAVVENTGTCTQCIEGFQRVVGHQGSSSDRCVKKIAIDNCQILGDCTLNAEQTSCVAGSQKCSACKRGFYLSTQGDRCLAKVAIPMTPIPFCAEHGGCTYNAEKTACASGTAVCKTCNAGFIKVDNSNDSTKDDACVVTTPIANCAVHGQCTVNADGVGCKSGSQTCARCAAGFMKVDNSADPSKTDACVAKFAIDNCATLGDCTLTANHSGCQSGTQKCAVCKSGFRQVSGSGDDTCTSCVSTSGPCGAGCGKDQGVYTDNNQCVKCSSTTPEDKCVPAICGEHVKFAWGKCRVNDATTTIVGRSSDDYSSCTAFSGESAPKWQLASCSKAFVNNEITACTVCSEDICTKGLCSGNKELKSGKCAPPEKVEQKDHESSAAKASVGLAIMALAVLN